MPTHSLTRGWQRNSDVETKRQDITADGEITAEIAVPDSSTDLQATVGIDVSEIKSLYLLSTQDVTIETNDGSSADDTIALKAGIPLIWENVSGYYDNPLSTDVTDLYITNASGSDATVTLRVLQDVTP
ncbi:MAG TPA: hypothetical protein DCM28_05180 [Phycisphaerales bacterium]|nr:hypothetical protein [Phycisphaerales bacterium]HCD32290.1 hypothetical protein [Phycisphaerales bacterium]|tara:strand:+ start:427 stop:813 length:387 start_codon:yes stop_codon:yes gene_type:complete